MQPAGTTAAPFDAPLKSWIAQVAYSVARRHLERRRIPFVESVDDDGMGLAERVADDRGLAATVADADCATHLHAAIEALPPLQRTLLTLYHFEELPIGEISRITGLTGAPSRATCPAASACARCWNRRSELLHEDPTQDPARTRRCPETNGGCRSAPACSAAALACLALSWEWTRAWPGRPQPPRR